MTAKKSFPLFLSKRRWPNLESVVGQLEQGELSLEDALQRFEQGVALVRTCQIALQAGRAKSGAVA
jgi:exodeoxyribonuclease VII small subunit